MNTLEQLNNYLERGWLLVANWGITKEGTCACGKPDCKNAGKHPHSLICPNGEKSPIANIGRIEYFCNKDTELNWGIALEPSNLTGIDVDPQHGGSLEIKGNEYIIYSNGKEVYRTPLTGLFRTGGGGYRVLYSGVTRSRELWPGVELLSIGKQTIAPPSLHRTGNYYVWVNDIPLIGLPADLREPIAKFHEKGFVSPKVIISGTRDKIILQAAGNLRSRGYSEKAILAACLAENEEKCKPPLDENEVIAIVTEYEDQNSAQELNLGDGSLTDWGNAMRFVNRYGDIIRYNKSFEWVIWNGRQWVINSLDIHKYAHDVARNIYTEAASVENNKDLSEAIGNWAHQSLGGYHLQEMLTEAIPYLLADTKVFDDSRHMLLNVQNGIVDLNTGELIPHDPQYFLTRIMNVAYDKTATCPRWVEFMEMIFPDPEVRRFVQKAVGYSLTGNSDEKVLFFLWGEAGNNGKSTFIRALVNLFGEYARETDIEVIMDSRRGGLTPLNEDFYNTRFVATNEINKSHRFSESVMKGLTGNDIINCNPKHRKPYSFLPTHKLWIFGNKKPRGGEDDDAFWNRMRLIAFDQSIPAEKQRSMEQVLAEFNAENAGILNWALQGLELYKVEGLRQPEKIEADTRTYRLENDWLERFIAEECVIDPHGKVAKEAFFNAYNSYLHDNQEQPTSKVDIGKRLSKLGYVAGGAGGKFYKGISFNYEPKEEYLISPEVG